MTVRIVAILLLSAVTAVLTSCSTVPRSLEDQATYYANEAKNALAGSDNTELGRNIETSLERPTGSAKIRDMFVIAPTARARYVAYLEQKIVDTNDLPTAVSALAKINLADTADVLPASDIRRLRALLGDLLANRNRTGAIAYDLSDDVSGIPELQTDEHFNIRLNRTLKLLLSGNADRRGQIKALMAYIEHAGKDSAAGLRIGASLPQMHIRREELALVAQFYPQFATERQAALTIRVFLELKNGDRLLADDVMGVLRREIRGVEWLTNPDPKAITLVIERLRNDERILAEQTQTITYAQYQVNVVEALLLMPRNASFLFEQISGGAEIEYGYVVTAQVNGVRVHDEVLRGKVGGESRRCQNARIQNIFGGVQPASFVANPDMARRCTGIATVSIDELRQQVLAKVAAGALNVPAIRAVHLLN